MADDTKVEALCDELRSMDVGDAVKVIGTWLEEHSLKHVLDSFHEAVLTDPTILGAQATLVSLPPQPAVQEKPPNAAPLTAPPAEALPVPAASTSSRPGKLYDAEPISSSQVSGELLTKPDPVFHGERDERQREAAPVYEFPMHVHYDPLTSGLESESHFRVEEKQVIAGRYVVIQYLGSGTFCHTVQCEDLKGEGENRFVCVKISKNTKDILDQNLWEVKLLKLLASKMDEEERTCLPLLLNVFYYRETLFIVYELLRDNLYHIYKYIEECRLPKYFTVERLQEVARQCLRTLHCLHQHEVIHCDLKPENILISSLTECKVKVIDYGNAYLHHDQRCSYVQSRAYRAPEVVLGLAYSPKVDMWSLGCILMELFTGKLLFDNRSVQALLASHIALRGPFPESMLQNGQLSHHYFDTTPGAPQWLVGKHDGNLCRMRPHVSSIANVLTHYGCKDEAFADFIGELLQLDPERRPSAEETLKHAWLQGNTPCAKYQIADSGEAGKRLRTKYPSLANVGESPSKASSSGGGNGEEVPGPATPTSFREQCYLDRERGEKKRSRKSAAQRLSSTDVANSLDHMLISPTAPASGGGDPKKGRAEDNGRG
mmetsp:Transcript_29680/g.70494  ORF Transcript_29680/g.70494 Transcript_29680/m.70494 type:complete len:602 (+) Transcript_29680:36-1841(+)